jgi:hypothetical protein
MRSDNAVLDRALWEQRPARAVDRWTVSADLGTMNDFTALSALRHVIEPLKTWTANPQNRTWKQDRIQTLHVHYLQRVPLGLSYIDIGREIALLMQRPWLAGADLVMDFTGAGIPACDIFDAIGLNPKRVTFTGGLRATQVDCRTWHVPKSLLINTLLAKAHAGELGVADEAIAAGALKEEMRDFIAKASKTALTAQYEGRGTAHDDLVCSIAMAVWYSLNRSTRAVAILNLVRCNTTRIHQGGLHHAQINCYRRCIHLFHGGPVSCSHPPTV